MGDARLDLGPSQIILTIAGGMPTLRAAEGVPIVTGVPVKRRANDYDDYEDVSTDQMQTSGRPPIVRGHRISDLRQQASHSPTSQRMMACLNVVSGIILPYMAYYYYLQYGDRMCSKPVAGWLYTYASGSVVVGVSARAAPARAPANARSSTRLRSG